MKKSNIITAFIFLITVFSGFILFILLPKQTISRYERRPLAAFPTPKNGAYFSQLDDYINDHFPFRTPLISLSAYTRAAAGGLCQAGVYTARGGYLVSAPEPVNQQRAKTNLEKINNSFLDAGISVEYLPVPQAGYVLNDQIIGPAPPYDDDAVFNLISPQNMIDLRPYLKDIPAYYKTDHHLNATGAYIAYTELCKKLGIAPLAADAFTVLKIPGFCGTTYAKSGLYLTMPDTLELWDSGAHFTLSVYDQSLKVHESFNTLFFTQNAAGIDPYSVYLGDNYGLAKIQNPDCVSNRRMLIIKDSYANSIAPLIANHFESVWLCDLRYWRQGGLMQLVKDEAVTDVVILMSAPTLANTTDFTFLN